MKVYGLECDHCKKLLLFTGEPADFLLAQRQANVAGWITTPKSARLEERDACPDCNKKVGR